MKTLTQSRTVKLIIPVFLTIMSISACHTECFWGVRREGDKIVETRNISGFNGIGSAMDADVYYLQDSVYNVQVSAQPNILKYIETEMHGGILNIDCRARLRTHDLITIIVHSPEIDGFHLSGNGNIYSKKNINTGSLDLSLSGSGNIFIQSVSAEKLHCRISGSGNIGIMGGSVKDENFHISGSGNIDALNLVSNTSEANISGSGGMMLYSLKYLEAAISGSGSVKYKGNPVVKSHVSGSGSVLQSD